MVSLPALELPFGPYLTAENSLYFLTGICLRFTKNEKKGISDGGKDPWP